MITAHALLRGLASSDGGDDDTFPTSYEDGYHLFVSLTCAIGFLFALFMASYTRKASTRVVENLVYGAPLSRDSNRDSNRDSKATGFVCAFFSALLVATSSAVLAWGVAVAPPFAGYMLVPIMVGGGLLVGLCVCSCFPDQIVPDSEEQDHTPVCSASLVNLQTISTLFLLIPGLVLLAMYCKQMADARKYEYHGPVRITGYQVDYFSSEFCRTDTYCFGYHGKLQVAFGTSWGCPNYPEKWCSSTVLDPDCTIYVCEARGDGFTTYDCSPQAECDCDAGRNEAESCMKKKYDLYQWSEKVDFDDPEYDRDVRPQEDPNWPSVSLYGDCSTCAATMQVPEERALELKSVGTGMAIAGASGYAIILLIGLVKLIRSRSCGRLVRNGMPEQGSCSKS